MPGVYVGYDTRRFTVGSADNELPGYWLLYSLDNGTTWTNVAALNPTLASVPNTIGVTTTPATHITFSSALANAGTVLLLWVDDNAVQSSPDQIIGLDNVTLSTTGSNSPPTVAITSPANNATVGTSFTISASAADSDGTIASVKFYDGTTLLTTATTSPYSYAWSGATPGSHALTAVALDNGGLTTTSAVVNVTVSNNSAPSAPVTVSPGNGATGLGTSVTQTRCPHPDRTSPSRCCRTPSFTLKTFQRPSLPRPPGSSTTAWRATLSI